MIISVTANPSVDRTIEVEALTRGAVLRARGVRVDPGGKGVNVARALRAHGHAARAVLPIGGAEGRHLAELLEAEGIDVVAVPIADAVRSNVTIVEPDGTTTKLNERGPDLDPSEVDAILRATVASAAGAGWVAVSGSLPPGAPRDFYARLVAALRAIGVRVALDTSGGALVDALAAGPELVKPNREELAEAGGRPVVTLGDAVAAAAALRGRGAGAVLASLGRDGAVLVDAQGAVHAEAAPVVPRSTVGAGDALLAGFLAEGGRGPRALAAAVAWGTAATALPGSRMPGPDDVDLECVAVHDAVDTGRALADPDPTPERPSARADRESPLARGASHA